MQKLLMSAIVLLMISVIACNNSDQKVSDTMNKENSLLKSFDTPYEVPPFGKIKIEDYLPAYKEAIAQNKEEIKAIVENTEEPTFENTIEALEYSGSLLIKVESVFQNLISSNSNEEMQAIAKEVSPLVTALGDEIAMNEKLFQRVKNVYDNCDQSKLDKEQKMLLKQTYKSFVRGGANLNEKDKAKLKEINKELGLLSLGFGANVLDENNRFELVIDKEEDLVGLPDGVKAAAATAAKEKHGEGKWLFTIQKPSLIPFLTYSAKRDLRKKMLMAYTMKGNYGDSLDNKEAVLRMANLRVEKANLLGYNNYAEYILEDNMAKTPERANELVNQVMKRAVKRAKEELVELQALADAEAANIKIEAWDWWYYAEKLRKAKYDLSEEEMRPYFKLDNVVDGMFDVAHKLFDMKFVENKELPKMDSLAVAYEVFKGDKMIAILYVDYFPRASKRSGAWMTSYRKQSYDKEGNNIMPIVSLTCNFTPANGETPSLLSMDEVTTLYHEFGHGLHGLLSDCKYQSLSGTSVARDFVELPSQIMENWAAEPSVMKTYAKHYITGEVIPDELIAKMKKASTFNNGFVASEFVGAGILDMAWHTLTEPFEGDVNEFEADAMKNAGLIDEIIVRYRSTFFTHIFAGGYAAGYYAYLWTAVLDADAFGAFTETSLFDIETAESLEENILSNGGTDEADVMWNNFRGREPKTDFYFERMGL